MEFTIEKLKADNGFDRFAELVSLFAEVFEMKTFSSPPEHHLQMLLKSPGFMVFVALSGETVVGGLTVYTLQQYYSVKPLAYIFDLAVQTRWQRRGIGRALVEAVKKDCADLGYEEVFVQADKIDDYALEFYRSTGITLEEDVSHFYYSLTPPRS
jgi:Acetyltransferases